MTGHELKGPMRFSTRDVPVNGESRQSLFPSRVGAPTSPVPWNGPQVDQATSGTTSILHVVIIL